VTDLTGHRLLVTGASSGIGRCIAEGACTAGARVVAAGRRADLLQEVAAGARGPGEMIAVAADVTDPGSARDLVRIAVGHLGGLDGLVNAVGVHSIGASEDLEDAELDRVLQTNLVGAFRVTREVGRVMLEAGGGAIVEVASLSSFGGFPGRLAYAISKAGLLEMTETLAAEWGRRGVRVNALVPGFVRTPIQERLVRSGQLDLAKLVSRIPLDRVAEPEDMVEPTLFLLSDASRYVTGQALVVDGGWLSFTGPVDRFAGVDARHAGGKPPANPPRRARRAPRHAGDKPPANPPRRARRAP
jgi:NAD(P)-dependent dehydrogenase (short-subunit alcohol dehydrogenase family)